MPILGAHMSIAGGFHQAVYAAHKAGCDCVQIFSKNNNQWRAKPIEAEQIEKFRQSLAETGIGHPLVHCSYLINLASPEDTLWQKSIDALVVELQRADQLGIPHVVLHPGAFVSSSEPAGLDRITLALEQAIQKAPGLNVRCLLETTAGQGSHLGYRFEHLAAILGRLNDALRFGVCLDTCHLFAAGYPLQSASDYERTMSDLDRQLGVEAVRAIHLNDSKQPFASRKDRHEHIGLGELGLEPFRHLLNDARFGTVPMYLETPKGDHEGKTWDEVNLSVLRGLHA